MEEVTPVPCKKVSSPSSCSARRNERQSSEESSNSGSPSTADTLQPRRSSHYVSSSVRRSCGRLLFSSKPKSFLVVSTLILTFTAVLTPWLWNSASTPAIRGLIADVFRQVADCVEGHPQAFVFPETSPRVPRRILQSAFYAANASGPAQLWQNRLSAVEETVQDLVENGHAAARLQQHNADFAQGIELVARHKVRNAAEEEEQAAGEPEEDYAVYVAVGFGLANVIIVESSKGLILIDSLESAHRMRELLEAFEKVSERGDQLPPILALFYSHFHTDHVFGGEAVVEGEKDVESPPQIWAHEATATEIEKVFSVVAGTTYKRSMMQFGTLLSSSDGFINAGIGPRLFYSAQDVEHLSRVAKPTHIWKGEQMTLTIGGVRMVWMRAPGESRDQTACWFPGAKALFAADNVYKSFPNIYAIRGTESRDPLVWVRTLDRLRNLPAEALVLGHTRPVIGRGEIQELLTTYRDAIQYVHDQTVRRMNKGLPLDEIVSSLALPRHLAEHPWLEPFYGTVEWTVRAVFSHYLGWYSGEAEDLNPLPKRERALRLALLAGGTDALRIAAVEALEAHDWQWALDLSSDLLRLDGQDQKSRHCRVVALRALAAQYVSAPGRNWLLTEAKREDEKMSAGTQNSGAQQPPLQRLFQRGPAPPAVTRTVEQGLTVTLAQRSLCVQSLKSPVDSLYMMQFRLNAEKAAKVDARIEFRFVDRAESACVHVRHGVAYAAPKCEKEPTLTVETTDAVWRKIITKQLSPVAAVSSGKFRLVPHDPLGYVRLKFIMSLVDFEDDNGGSGSN